VRREYLSSGIEHSKIVPRGFGLSASQAAGLVAHVAGSYRFRNDSLR